MNVQQHAIRTQLAQERLLAAAETLADRFGLAAEHAALTEARHKRPEVAVLYQREAVAALLDALVRVSEPTADLPEPEQRLAALTVAEVRERIAAAGDAADLNRLEYLEAAGANRKTVFAAITRRRDELAASNEEGAE